LGWVSEKSERGKELLGEREIVQSEKQLGMTRKEWEE
jgi:hypothetical protein